MMLDDSMKRLQMEGYMGNTKEVLFDLAEEGKELALTLHSEKLAVAFCFLMTSPGTPIRIICLLGLIMHHIPEDPHVLELRKKQFTDALTIFIFTL